MKYVIGPIELEVVNNKLEVTIKDESERYKSSVGVLDKDEVYELAELLNNNAQIWDALTEKPQGST